MFVFKKYDRQNQVLWRNISDFYVSLRVETPTGNFSDVFFYLGQE